MGGVDKGLLTVNHTTLIELCISNIRPQVGNIVINANRNLSKYRQFTDMVVPDRTDDFLGPLSGILTAMEWLQQQQLDCQDIVTVPCDMPLLPLDLVTRLYLARNTDRVGAQRVVVAHDGQRLQPLCSLLPMSARPKLQEFLDSGHRKVSLWVEFSDALIADFSDVGECFSNINTPAELQAFNAAVNS